MTDTDNTQPQDDRPAPMDPARILGIDPDRRPTDRQALAAERAAHEEHRHAMAAALGNPEAVQWPRLIRAAEQIAAGRRTWREKAEEIEADRDRLAAQLTAARAENDGWAEAMRNSDRLTTQQLGETRARADTAEAALARLRALLPGNPGDDKWTDSVHAASVRAALDGDTRPPVFVCMVCAAPLAQYVVCEDCSDCGCGQTPCVRTGMYGQAASSEAAGEEREHNAEQTLAAVRTIARRLAAHAKGFQDVLDDTDRGPWARTAGADIEELTTALGDDQSGETEPEPRLRWTDLLGVIEDDEPAVPREQPAEPGPHASDSGAAAPHLAAALVSYLAAITPIAESLHTALGEQR